MGCQPILEDENNELNVEVEEPVAREVILNTLDAYTYVNDLERIREELFEILWMDELQFNPQRPDETNEMLLERKNTFRLMLFGLRMNN